MSNKIFERLLEKYKQDETRDEKILVGFFRLDNGDYATVSVKKFEAYDTPHMHIDADGVHLAVRLDKPKYYYHDEYEGELHDTEINRFINMLNENYKGTNMSNWEFVATEFNRVYESQRLMPTPPDYTVIND